MLLRFALGDEIMQNRKMKLTTNKVAGEEEEEEEEV